MDKKLELLAKTLMDASKIMFVSVFATYLLSSSEVDYVRLLFIILLVMIVGYLGWLVHPTIMEKEERSNGFFVVC